VATKQKTSFDTPPSSLMDSTISIKVNIMEGNGIGVCSLVHNTSRVEGRAGAPRWTRKIDK